MQGSVRTLDRYFNVQCCYWWTLPSSSSSSHAIMSVHSLSATGGLSSYHQDLNTGWTILKFTYKLIRHLETRKLWQQVQEPADLLNTFSLSMTCLPSRTNWLSSSAPVSRLTGLEVVLLSSWRQGLVISVRAAPRLSTTPTPSLANLSSLAPLVQWRPRPHCITWPLCPYPLMLPDSDSNQKSSPVWDLWLYWEYEIILGFLSCQ